MLSRLEAIIRTNLYLGRHISATTISTFKWKVRVLASEENLRWSCGVRGARTTHDSGIQYDRYPGTRYVRNQEKIILHITVLFDVDLLAVRVLWQRRGMWAPLVIIRETTVVLY